MRLRPSSAAMLLRDMHRGRYYVEPIEFKIGFLAIEVVGVSRSGDRFFFTGEEREIVVVPEDGDKVVATLSFCNPEMHLERDTVAGVFRCHGEASLAAFMVNAPFEFKLDGRERV